MASDYAWNCKKGKAEDMAGLAFHSEHREKVKTNAELDLSRSHMNYDLISSDLGIQKRINNRIDEVRENSRIQKNSVFFHSHILTLPEEYYKPIIKDSKVVDFEDKEVIREYFSDCVDYFKEELGEKNIVAACVHLDETRPHMHLFSVPVNIENGMEKLQGNKCINDKRIDEMHDRATEFLRRRGHDVVRGTGEKTRTLKSEKLNVHEFKELMEKQDKVLSVGQKRILEEQEDLYRRSEEAFFRNLGELEQKRNKVLEDIQEYERKARGLRTKIKELSSELEEYKSNSEFEMERLNALSSIIVEKGDRIKELDGEIEEKRETIGQLAESIERGQGAVEYLTEEIRKAERKLLERQRQLEARER